uniref:Leucine rich immune protein (Short) n=1 Tax=Anopheles dirus TaxID=7168 RepID=A0A182NJN4_9DIPT
MALVRAISLISVFNAYYVASGQDQLLKQVERLQQQQKEIDQQIKQLLWLIEQQQKNQTSDSNNDNFISSKRHPGPIFMCRESNLNYDCIFHDVAITRETTNVYFGYADVAMNNQTKITFKNSHMQVLPQPLLGFFRHVELLDLSALQMEEILPAAFVYGGSIKELYLSFNDIQSLPANVFYHLKSLEILIMDRNKLSSLAIRTFITTPNLIVLSLSNNNLERIEDGTFNRTTSLGYLNLAKNKLTHIDLSLIPSLNTVNVSYNQLTELLVPAQIEILDASHNQIRSVSGQNREQLERLYLAHNNLTGIAWLENFNALTFLDLSHNELEAISAKHLTNARTLSILLLQHNRLMRLNLPRTLTTLRVLDVSHNSLVLVENNQQQFGTLRQLYLDHNSIVTIKILPENTLQNLTMSHNDWDCKNLREHIYLMGKVDYVDLNCKEDYKLLNGLCCKETDKPYLDRLNEQINATSHAEKIQRADGRCSAARAVSDALSLASFAARSEAELIAYQSQQTDISRLEKENLQLKNVVQRDNTIFLRLHDEIDANIRRYRVSKEGLVNESVNLGKVFKHLAVRHEFKQKESKDRRLEANGKLNSTVGLGKSLTTLQQEVDSLTIQIREVKLKQKETRSRITNARLQNTRNV